MNNREPNDEMKNVLLPREFTGIEEVEDTSIGDEFRDMDVVTPEWIEKLKNQYGIIYGGEVQT